MSLNRKEPKEESRKGSKGTGVCFPPVSIQRPCPERALKLSQQTALHHISMAFYFSTIYTITSSGIILVIDSRQPLLEPLCISHLRSCYNADFCSGGRLRFGRSSSEGDASGVIGHILFRQPAVSLSELSFK